MSFYLFILLLGPLHLFLVGGLKVEIQIELLPLCGLRRESTGGVALGLCCKWEVRADVFVFSSARGSPASCDAARGRSRRTRRRYGVERCPQLAEFGAGGTTVLVCAVPHTERIWFNTSRRRDVLSSEWQILTVGHGGLSRFLGWHILRGIIIITKTQLLFCKPL